MKVYNFHTERSRPLARRLVSRIKYKGWTKQREKEVIPLLCWEDVEELKKLKVFKIPREERV